MINEPQAAVSEHTREPWTQDGCRVLGQSIHGEPNGKVVAITGVGLTRQADSRRIVACVNACAGIPTEELEGKMLADQQAALTEAERDCLWDACLAEGHGPDAFSRVCPNRNDDPCPICAEMIKQHPVFLARGGHEA